MNIERFFSHHQLIRNPFDAEEARHDPIFEQLIDQSPVHPDFGKILGRIEHPGTAVVFGEKGSGKTAIRLLMGKRLAQHNTDNPTGRVLVVAYDDLNPVLDRVVERARRGRIVKRRDPDTLDYLQTVRLEDHQDGILALAVTRLVDAALGIKPQVGEPVELPTPVDKTLKHLPRGQRLDLLAMAALYDQPRSGNADERWVKLKRKLRLGWVLPMSLARLAATIASVAAVVAYAWAQFVSTPPSWLVPTAGLLGGSAVLLWAAWISHHVSLWRMCRRIAKETPALDRPAAQLRTMIGALARRDRRVLPWPTPGVGSRDARYQLTHRLLAILQSLGYVGMIVLVDRVDEPTLVTGKPDRMRAVVWPMLDNKFLQQERVGIKLLLPIELRHLLYRESTDFFQEARLDKQNMIDRLSWSGAVLYDLCSARLKACRAANADPYYLTDLFEPDVTREVLVDALDAMHQPRDAFKFLYNVVLEHCRMLPDDKPRFRIPRLVLEAIRRQQSQRVQELYRGLSPA